MTFRPTSRSLPSMLLVCVFFPGTGAADEPVPAPGPGGHRHHEPVPKPPPNWNYYQLPGGPELTTDYPFKGFPGYRGAFGSVFTNGPHLSRTPVPVYTPVPAVMCDDPLVHPVNQRKRLGLGLGYYGWVGPYAASPRPKPATVSVWSPADPRGSSHGK